MNELITKLTVPELANGIRASGYHAEVAKDKDGKEQITFSAGGHKCYVFYGAQAYEQNSGLRNFSIIAYIDYKKILDAYDINLFNSKMRFGHIYVSEKGTLCFTMSLSFIGGVSKDHIMSMMKQWDSELGEALQYVLTTEIRVAELKKKMDEIVSPKEQSQ